MAGLTQGGGILNPEEFERALSGRFPAIAAQTSDDGRGLLHCEMASLAPATCRAIERDDLLEVRAHFGFVVELFSDAGPDLENAAYVSYLENVSIGREDRRYALVRTMRSSRLQTALAEIEEHWRNIADWKSHQTPNPDRR